jgi:hypothetical protein
VLPGVFAAPDAALTLRAKALTRAASSGLPREEADAWGHSWKSVTTSAWRLTSSIAGSQRRPMVTKRSPHSLEYRMFAGQHKRWRIGRPWQAALTVNTRSY